MSPRACGRSGRSGRSSHPGQTPAARGPSKACRARAQRTAGGIPGAAWAGRGASAHDTQPPRRHHGHTVREKEDLGGEQSPWKDRAVRHRKRRRIATDSSAEQGLEVGHSEMEPAGALHRKRTAHQRAESSPARDTSVTRALAAGSRPSGRSRTSVRGSRVLSTSDWIFGSECSRVARRRTTQARFAGNGGVTARGLAEGVSSVAPVAWLPPAATRERE